MTCGKDLFDDIALLWTQGEENLKLFITWLNEQHPTIKFTSNYGSENIPFLDVSVSIKEGKLVTDVYIKETDAGMILPFHSCHPRHCVMSIPYGQCLRIRRICSEESLFQEQVELLKNKYVLNRGYPLKLVQNAIQKVTEIPRVNALQYKKRDNKSKRVPYVITHNPSNPPLASWLKCGLNVLHSSRRMEKVSPSPPIVRERNCKNLRSLIMPSKPPQIGQQQRQISSISRTKGAIKCDKRCLLCAEHLNTSQTFQRVRTQQEFHNRDLFKCD